MKNFNYVYNSTLSEESELPTLYCDMDQVLCNFMKGADAAVGGSFVNTDKDERWAAINQTKGFWANLEWMPGAKSMYQFIEKYDPYIFLTILNPNKNEIAKNRL